MNEAIREMFLTEWVETASIDEIVEKLIEHDERAKQIQQLKEEIVSFCSKFYELKYILIELEVYIRTISEEEYVNIELYGYFGHILQLIEKGLCCEIL